MFAERPTAPSPLPRQPEVTPPPSVPLATNDAVDRILSYTDTAVDSIVRRTEHQVREIAAVADARSAREAADRQVQLAELRRELTDRASALALHYEEILNQLDAAEAALGVWAGHGAGGRADFGDPRVDAIKMTLRERQRISVAYEEAPTASLSAVQAPPTPPPFVEQQARRRWWRPWHREAA